MHFGKVKCKLCQRSWTSLAAYQQDTCNCTQNSCYLKQDSSTTVKPPLTEQPILVLPHTPLSRKVEPSMRATQVGTEPKILKHPIPKQMPISVMVKECEVQTPNHVTEYMNRLFIKVPKAIVFDIQPKKGK
jgi:hypothetical protein